MYFKTSNPERSEAGSCSLKLQLTCPEAESTGQTEDDKHPKEVFILLCSERALQEARLHYTAQENDVPTLAAPMPPAAVSP